MFSRYAVFFTIAPDQPLARFGAAWLGWDSAVGAQVPRFETDGVDVAAITRSPHKYGFHGTIKAPFRLAEGQAEADLIAGFDTFCAVAAPASLPGVHLSRLGRFLALIPEGDVSQLLHLAGRVVQDLDIYRAPLNDAEIARRSPDRLLEKQREYLDQWGYPHVLDAFRFHMTLTDRLDKATGENTEAALQKALKPIAMPTRIDTLTLMGESQDGRFHRIKRTTLGQSAR